MARPSKVGKRACREGPARSEDVLRAQEALANPRRPWQNAELRSAVEGRVLVRGDRRLGAADVVQGVLAAIVVVVVVLVDGLGLEPRDRVELLDLGRAQ
eukprot:CAMPEP_0175395238 /NCGR_PEP_ID=MMETSP0095-20121207/33846_1 /TAXON_ID=311494 /ORGANISM="Alexandrium monilatum, Strain CCMP3105" /LENGTH=98 /DNA_ID=CAMNT_0016693863 /DNA_START=200 /DNA_END=493 /DNA_ORIENTATION=+